MSELAISEALNTVVKLPYSNLHKNGLEITEQIDVRQWSTLSQALKSIEGSTLWWWGDLLVYGEQKYGEMYSQALDPDDYKYQTLRQAKLICERIELFRRRNNLLYSHHAEIAYAFTDQVKQDEWLDWAEKENATVQELRKAIRIDKGEYKPNEINEPKASADIMETFIAFKNAFIRETKKKPIQDWPKERLEAFEEDFEWLQIIRNQINIALHKND